MTIKELYQMACSMNAENLPLGVQFMSCDDDIFGTTLDYAFKLKLDRKEDEVIIYTDYSKEDC